MKKAGKSLCFFHIFLPILISAARRPLCCTAQRIWASQHGFSLLGQARAGCLASWSGLSATPLGAPQNLGSNSELQSAVLLEMKLLQPEHHNTKAMEILISSVLTFLQAISATPYLYLLFFFFYLLIGKAWKIFVFIHPEEMHIRITCAEVGNNHVEIDDQPHTPK